MPGHNPNETLSLETSCSVAEKVDSITQHTALFDVLGLSALTPGDHTHCHRIVTNLPGKCNLMRGVSDTSQSSFYQTLGSQLATGIQCMKRYEEQVSASVKGTCQRYLVRHNPFRSSLALLILLHAQHKNALDCAASPPPKIPMGITLAN